MEPVDCRITVVVLTYNRAAEVSATVAALLRLPDRARLIVVDNASTDGTPARLAARFPDLQVVVAPANLGAAGRNLGVAQVRTDYVAFCDDDTCWAAGALDQAVQMLDRYPQVGVLSARVVVGAAHALDPTCQLMQASPLRQAGLPGPALIGYMAGAGIFRTALYRAVGGYEPRLFIGGEEQLVALDVLSSGHAIVYAEQLELHHRPSVLRDSALRRRMLARNAAWVAWLRLPRAEAWRCTAHALGVLQHEKRLWRDAPSLLLGVLWACRQRRPIAPRIEALRRAVRAAEQRDKEASVD